MNNNWIEKGDAALEVGGGSIRNDMAKERGNA